MVQVHILNLKVVSSFYALDFVILGIKLLLINTLHLQNDVIVFFLQPLC